MEFVDPDFPHSKKSIGDLRRHEDEAIVGREISINKNKFEKIEEIHRKFFRPNPRSLSMAASL